MKMELTNQEKIQLADYMRDYLFDIRFSTFGYDKKAVGRAIKRLYEIANIRSGFGPIFSNSINKIFGIDLVSLNPKIVWCDSPIDCIKHYEFFTASKLNKENFKRELYNCHKGQEEDWIGYYCYCRDVLGVEFDQIDNEKLDLWIILAKNCNWWYPYENVVFLSYKPIEYHVEEYYNENWQLFTKHRLHNLEGPAVLYKDGYARYAIHGKSISKEEWEQKIKKEIEK